MRLALAGLAGRVLLLAVLLIASRAHAHDQWANGAPVPPWVKASCCGPEDVHHLTAAQVHAMPDGWHVEGFSGVIAYGRELPSQDGDYWIFYRTFSDGTQTPAYCFFAPAQSF
jgi:hypothetical protein